MIVAALNSWLAQYLLGNRVYYIYRRLRTLTTEYWGGRMGKHVLLLDHKIASRRLSCRGLLSQGNGIVVVKSVE